MSEPTAGPPPQLDITRSRIALDPDELDGLVLRFRRAQGQLGAIATMLQEGRDCAQIVHQLSAVKRAVDRAGFVFLEASMRQCLTRPGSTPADVQAMEKLFLALS